jgi:hypothetical protein
MLFGKKYGPTTFFDAITQHSNHFEAVLLELPDDVRVF